MITIGQKITKEMEAKGHKFLGQTRGTYSFRKGSNLAFFLVHIGKTEEEVIVRTGARAGKNANDGYQLLVFSK